MRASLRALLEGLIDYAGLFPPAKLPMQEALANYRRYREGEAAGMLGRFVCPAAWLKDIPPGDAMTCSALARGGDSAEAFLAGLDADLADIEASQVRVEALEAKLPGAALADTLQAASVIDQTLRRLKPRGLSVFFEAPVSEALALGRVVSPLHALADLDQVAGFKLRAGGLEAVSFPSSLHVAQAMHLCHSADVPLKATAGLHHPLPRFDTAVQARMHGFVNFFIAGVLIRARGLTMNRVVELLDDDDPASFVFTDDELRWRDVTATTEEVREARRTAMISFGSCSFDEPRDDLRALGWL
ncbi:MAG: hypothetical protein U0797_07495 [Gemmataceae bacterium]